MAMIDPEGEISVLRGAHMLKEFTLTLYFFTVCMGHMYDLVSWPVIFVTENTWFIQMLHWKAEQL